MARCLLIVDPQNDFCDGPANGALPVPGAWDDMARLADHLRRAGDGYDAIMVTLDSHNTFDIGHPTFWKTDAGQPLEPFTQVSLADVEAGRIKSADPGQALWVRRYLGALENSGHLTHMVWPEHCVLGTTGHQVHPEVAAALQDWQRRKARPVAWTIKGLNARVEHYSAFKCEVDDPEDSVTPVIQRQAIKTLSRFDTIHVAGEALSHCVRQTVEDLLQGLRYLGVHKAETRLTLLTDTMSPVPAVAGGPDFPALGQRFLEGLEKRGAVLATTDSLAA